MLIGKNYKIESDDLQVTLYERRINKGKSRNPKKITKAENIGKEYWTPIGYYLNIRNALRGFLNTELLRSGFKDIETICKKIDEVHSLIEDWCATVENKEKENLIQLSAHPLPIIYNNVEAVIPSDVTNPLS